MKDVYPKKFLGLDYGFERTGVAIASEESFLAVPYDLIETNNLETLLLGVKNIVVQEEISVVIVGTPLGKLEGKYTQTKSAEFFVKKLQEFLGIEVIMEDERFSTRMAVKLNPQGDDSVAAAVILQSYLDRIRKT